MSINVIDKLKHASGGAVADAADIEMSDGTRLQDAVEQLRADLEGSGRAEFTSLTQAQYDALAGAELVYDEQHYLIVKTDSYTPVGLDEAQIAALAAAGLLPEEGA